MSPETTVIPDKKVNGFLQAVSGKVRDLVPALTAPDFRRYWIAQLLSFTGTWMQVAAQAWLVLELTDSPFALGIIGSLQFAPMLFFSVLAGALVDRFPKRRLLMFTQSFLAFQAVLLGVLTLTGLVEYWHIAVLAFCLGLANTLDVPGRQAFVQELVQRKEFVMNAIALNSTVFNIARLLGPATAGILSTLIHIGWIFILNSLTFVPVIIVMSSFSVGRSPAQAGAIPVLQSIAEGLRYVRHNPLLWRPLLLLLVLSIFSINFNVIVPVFAKEHLGVDVRGYGFLLSSLGAGAVVGAILMIYLSRFGPRREFVYTGAFGLSLFQALLPLARGLLPAAALLVLTGVCMMMFISTTNTRLQVNSDEVHRGRVMGLYTLVFGGATPIGNPIIGFISQHAGVATALVFGGGTGFISTLLYATARTYARRNIRPGESRNGRALKM